MDNAHSTPMGAGPHLADADAPRANSSDANTTAEPQPGDATSLGWWVRTIAGWLLLIAMAAVLLALVVVPQVSGAQAYTVLTGSMRPTIEPGALVVVRPTPAEELRAGDVVTVQPRSGDPTVVTHRITGTYYDLSGQLRITTQGDANNVPDDWTLVPEQVRGVLWYSVPQLGHVNLLLTGDMRALGLVVIAGGLLVYAVVMVGAGAREAAQERRRR